MLTKTIKTDLTNSEGMPIGVQVVGYMWEDEVCLGIMKALDDAVGFNKYPDI